MKKILLLLLFISNISLSQISSISNGNWSTPSTWSGGVVPGSNTDVIINHTVTISTVVKCRNLTINSKLINSNSLELRGSIANNSIYVGTSSLLSFKLNTTHNITGTISTYSLLIPSGVTVSLLSNLYVTDVANIDGILNSNGKLILYNTPTLNGRLGKSSGVIVGNFTSQKYINRCNKWSSYSNPFTTTYNLINDSSQSRMIYTGFPGSDYPSFSFINAYKYTEGVGYVIPTNINNNISRGSGYYYWNSDTVFNTNSPSIPQNWKISVTGNIDLSSGFTYSITYSVLDGWNLLGNPYPGLIDWSNTNWVKSNILNTVYTWNTCNQNYTAWSNGVGVNGGSKYISNFQGFWIVAIGSSPFLSSPSSVIVDNQTSMLRTSQLPQNTLMISTSTDETAIGFDTLATNGVDYDIDSPWLDPVNKLYSIIGSKYMINFVSPPILPDTIDIGLIGTDTLLFTGIEGFTNHSLFLWDSIIGTTYPLYSGYKHGFSESNTNDIRYKIIFQPVITTSIETHNSTVKNKVVIKTINTLGQDINPSEYTGIIIYIYSDGSSRKSFNMINPN